MIIHQVGFDEVTESKTYKAVRRKCISFLGKWRVCEDHLWDEAQQLAKQKYFLLNWLAVAVIGNKSIFIKIYNTRLFMSTIAKYYEEKKKVLLT